MLHESTQVSALSIESGAQFFDESGRFDFLVGEVGSLRVERAHSLPVCPLECFPFPFEGRSRLLALSVECGPFPIEVRAPAFELCACRR